MLERAIPGAAGASADAGETAVSEGEAAGASEAAGSNAVEAASGAGGTVGTGAADAADEIHLKKRQEQIQPLVEAFFAWLKSLRSKIPSRTKTGEGFTYCLNQEPYLRYFLEDGEVPMDNNAAERAIRPFCIGKKNWVMIDTVNGANASAVIYSIAETAKANHLNPFRYFEHLLTVIPEHIDDKTLDFMEDLAPWSENLPEICRQKLK